MGLTTLPYWEQATCAANLAAFADGVLVAGGTILCPAGVPQCEPKNGAILWFTPHFGGAP